MLQPLRPEHVAGDILHRPGEVANFPFRVQNSGLFRPNLTVTHQFH